MSYPNVTVGYHVFNLVAPAFALSVDTVAIDGGLATDDFSAVGTPITIGQNSNGEVDLAELLVVAAAVPPADQAKLSNYFSTKRCSR